jgi:cell division control protein 11
VAHIEEGVKIKPITVGMLSSFSLSVLTVAELDEEGTRISLTIVDTPGFGDQIDNEARFALTLFA